MQLRDADDSVFNHYNRVHANLSTIDSDEDDIDWSETAAPDGMPLLHLHDAIIFINILGVSSARINPHPLRLPIPSAPLRQTIPLFEKSNVLVMYVSYVLPKVTSVADSHSEARLAQVSWMLYLKWDLYGLKYL